MGFTTLSVLSLGYNIFYIMETQPNMGPKLAIEGPKLADGQPRMFSVTRFYPMDGAMRTVYYDRQLDLYTVPGFEVTHDDQMVLIQTMIDEGYEKIAPQKPNKFTD